MKDKGISKRIRIRLEKIHEETSMTIRTEEGLSKKFITKKRVRQR